MKAKFFLIQLIATSILFAISPSKAFAGFSGGKVYAANNFSFVGGTVIYLLNGGNVNLAAVPENTFGQLTVPDFPLETTTGKIMRVALVAADEMIDNCYVDYKSWSVEYPFNLPLNEEWFVASVGFSGTTMSVGGLNFDSIMGNPSFPDLKDGSYRFVILAESKDSIQSSIYKYPAIDVIYTTPFYISGTGNSLPEGAMYFTAEVKKEYGDGNGFSEPIDHFSPYMTETLYMTTGIEFNHAQHIDSIGLLSASYTPVPANIKNAVFLKPGWQEGHWSNVDIRNLELKTNDASIKIEGGAYRFVIKTTNNEYYYSQVFAVTYPADPKIDHVYESATFEVMQTAFGGLVYIRPYGTVNASTLSGDTRGYLEIDWNNNTTANLVSLALVSTSDHIDNCYFQKQYHIEYPINLPVSQTTGFLSGVASNGDAVTGIAGISFDGFKGLSGSYRFVIVAESKTTRKIDGYDVPLYNIIYTPQFYITSTNTPPAGMTPFEAALHDSDNTPVCHIPYGTAETFNLTASIDFNPESVKLLDAYYSLTPYVASSFGTSLGGMYFTNSDAIYPGAYRFILKKGENDYYYSQVFVIEDIKNETDDIDITCKTTENSAVISWNKVPEAVGYTLKVYTDEARTQLFNSYTLDADGMQLSSPTNFRSQTGFSATAGIIVYTLQNLSAKTHYYYTLEALGENATVINYYTGDFATQSGTGVAEITNCKLRIGIENGELRMENYAGGVVMIYDATGRAVGALRATPLPNGTTTINVSHLPAGIYIVHTGSQSAKFIKK